MVASSSGVKRGADGGDGGSDGNVDDMRPAKRGRLDPGNGRGIGAEADDDDEDVPTPTAPPQPPSSSSQQQCPYLDTIDRKRLDFDFEKCCSVSIRKENCYACLVCGKYFQGRGRGTHAYVVSD